MRVMILGGTGMLGHKVWQVHRDLFDTWVVARASFGDYARYGLYDADRFLGGVDAFDFDKVALVVRKMRPDVIINCIGVIKQLPEARDPIVSITLNSLFPHRLARLSQDIGARMIHISTDCVFSGSKGMYSEEDHSDAEDLYGKTKFLGEVAGSGCLTIRTSIIGREVRSASGLVEWFLSNDGGRVQGYTGAIYSGLTTLALARIIADIIHSDRSLEGLYHISSHQISKYDLLCLLRDAFEVRIEIQPDSGPKCDRSLDSSCFRHETGFRVQTWDEMIQDMASDPTPYKNWRSYR